MKRLLFKCRHKFWTSFTRTGSDRIEYSCTSCPFEWTEPRAKGQT